MSTGEAPADLTPQPHGGALRQPWRPGESGNPRGAQKGSIAARLKELLEEESRKRGVPVDELLAIATNKRIKPSDRLDAIKEIANRTDGRPQQHIDMTVNEADPWVLLNKRWAEEEPEPEQET